MKCNGLNRLGSIGGPIGHVIVGCKLVSTYFCLKFFRIVFIFWVGIVTLADSIEGMKFDPGVSEPETNSDTNTAGSDGAGGGDVLRLELVDLEGMDSKGLFNLMFDILATRHILDGYMTEALNRYGDLVGEGELRALCLQFGMGRYLANREARTAGALRELLATVDAVKAGGFSIDHARLLGESHGRVPLTRAQEDDLINKAKTEDLDRFRKTLARQEDDRRGTDGESRLDQQRRRRKAAVFNGDDGMVVLHAELDQVTGERVKTALDGMCDRLFRDDSKNGNDRTHQQRAADALAALITQTPGNTAAKPTSTTSSYSAPPATPKPTNTTPHHPPDDSNSPSTATSSSAPNQPTQPPAKPANPNRTVNNLHKGYT